MSWDNEYYYGNNPSNNVHADQQRQAEQQRQRERENAEDQRRIQQYQMDQINDLTRRDKFVDRPHYAEMATGAAAGYAMGWGLKQIWRGLFGRRP